MGKAKGANQGRGGTRSPTLPASPAGVQLLAQRLRVVMGIMESLEACPDEKSLTRAAVELARQQLGLERCGLFLREDDHYRGTFGTDFDGNTTVEDQNIQHYPEEVLQFAGSVRGGLKTWTRIETNLTCHHDGRAEVRGTGEVAMTVLRIPQGNIGFFFNDNAISSSPIDAELQEAVAIYCSLLANLLERQRDARRQDNARQLLQHIFDDVPSSILIYSAPDTIYTANATARSIYNLGDGALRGTPISAMGLTPDELRHVIDQNHHLLTAGDNPVASDEITFHVHGKTKVFKRLKFPIILPESGDKAVLSIATDITEIHNSAERQHAISKGLRKVVTIADELATIRDRKLFFRRAIEFAREDLGFERCALFFDDAGFHQGTWGINAKGEIVDESCFRMPINEQAHQRVIERLESSPEGYFITEGNQTELSDGKARIVGYGAVATTPIRSHNKYRGVFYNDNLFSGAPLDPTKQEVLCVFCSILGNLITRRTLEEERERGARQYQKLFEETPTANFICSIDGTILAANRPFALLLEFPTLQHALGGNITNFLSTRETLRLRRRFETQGALSGELVRARTAHGQQLILSVHISAIVGDTNNTIGYQGFLVDNTEQLRAEQALEELARATALPGGEGFFPALLDGLASATRVPHIILCESIPNRPTSLRIIAERQIGVPAGTDFDCRNIPGELVLRIGEFHQESSLHQSFPECGIAQSLRAEGFYGLTLLSSSGGLVGALGIFSTAPLLLSPRIESIIRIFAARAAAEIERMRAEHALRDSEARFLQAQKLEALGRFAGSIAHDFNNLLTTILTLSDMATDTLPTSHPVHEDISQINRIAIKAGNLTRQLLNFGRSQARGAVPLRIDRLLADLQGMLNRLLGESIRLEIDVHRDAGAITIDKSQFEQVIVNLAVNARDAMPKGGIIRINARQIQLHEQDARVSSAIPSRDYVALHFADSGFGILPEHMPHIFEPFFTTKGENKGTGLGLFTVYSIITQNGGSISVHSTPGEGTAFEILLPKAQFTPREETPAPEESAFDSPTTRHETILLAEDDDTVRRSVVAILRRMKYNVLEAPGGGEALLACERHPGPIDLLLTDIRMPHMNGFELAQRVRRLRPGIRVVYMSGYIDDIEGRDRPPNAEVLAKPFTSKVLNAWIRSELEKVTRESTGELPFPPEQ